jgi:hypothetical protein
MLLSQEVGATFNVAVSVVDLLMRLGTAQPGSGFLSPLIPASIKAIPTRYYSP